MTVRKLTDMNKNFSKYYGEIADWMSK